VAKASKPQALSLNDIMDGLSNKLCQWKYRLKEVKNTLLNGVYTGEKYSLYLSLLLVKTIRKIGIFLLKLYNSAKCA
jgi:hypothetical protein